MSLSDGPTGHILRIPFLFTLIGSRGEFEHPMADLRIVALSSSLLDGPGHALDEIALQEEEDDDDGDQADRRCRGHV